MVIAVCSMADTYAGCMSVWALSRRACLQPGCCKWFWSGNRHQPPCAAVFSWTSNPSREGNARAYISIGPLRLVQLRSFACLCTSPAVTQARNTDNAVHKRCGVIGGHRKPSHQAAHTLPVGANSFTPGVCACVCRGAAVFEPHQLDILRQPPSRRHARCRSAGGEGRAAADCFGAGV